MPFDTLRQGARWGKWLWFPDPLCARDSAWKSSTKEIADTFEQATWLSQFALPNGHDPPPHRFKLQGRTEISICRC